MQLASKGIHCNIIIHVLLHTCVDKGWTQGGILVPNIHLLLATEGWTGILGRLFICYCRHQTFCLHAFCALRRCVDTFILYITDN